MGSKQPQPVPLGAVKPDPPLAPPRRFNPWRSMSEEDERTISPIEDKLEMQKGRKMNEHVTIKCKAAPPSCAATLRDAVICGADGSLIPNVRSVDIHLAWDCVNVVKIEVLPDEIEIDAQGYPLTCRHDGQEYVMVPRDHWERIQRREGEHD